jgi:hypothetical protein
MVDAKVRTIFVSMGLLLHLLDVVSFSFKENVDLGTNNQGVFLALFYFLNYLWIEGHSD